MAKRATRSKAKPKTPARRKVRQISWLDRFLRTLPFSEDEVQRFFNWAILGLLIVGALFAAHWSGLTGIAHAQYAQLAARAGFEVKRVEITGMHRVDQLKVYEKVLAEKDRAMPLVDIDAIRDELQGYGWIKEARVSRRLPDTLVVDITERKPAALWKHDGVYSLVDEQGIKLEDTTPQRAGGLPLLEGTNANKQAVALAALLDKATALKAQVVGASWIGNRRWDLKFKSGETLALPEGEDAAAEAFLNFARMDGTRRLLGRKVKPILYFDFRDPARAYFRMAPKPEPVKPKPEQAKPKAEPDDKNDGKEA